MFFFPILYFIQKEVHGFLVEDKGHVSKFLFGQCISFCELNIAEAYSENSQRKKIEGFEKILNGLQPLKIFLKLSWIFDWVRNTTLQDIRATARTFPINHLKTTRE